MFVEKEKNLKILGIYENIAIKDSKVLSSFASFICENIHNKKFKSPYLFEIYSTDTEEGDTQIIFKVNNSFVDF